MSDVVLHPTTPLLSVNSLLMLVGGGLIVAAALTAGVVVYAMCGLLWQRLRRRERPAGASRSPAQREP